MPQHPVSDLFILLGIWLIGLGIWQWRRAAVSYSWPESAGEILENGASEVSNLDGGYNAVLKLRYRYVVNGTSFEGKRLRFGESVSSSFRSAEAWVERYPAGAAVRVRYNPRRPSESALEPGKGRRAGATVLPGMFTIIIAVLARLD
jgi:Protein of unknown function (DUF3592)